MTPSPESPTAVAVRAALARFVSTEGHELLEDPRRVRAMLSDAVPGSTAEANLLGLAISSGAVSRLRGGASPEQVAADLEQSSSVQPADARWIVGVIAQALGLHQTTVEPKMVETTPPADPPAPHAPAPTGRGGPSGPSLTVRTGSREQVFHAGGITIGRDPGCSISLDNPGVSRLHARIELGPTGWEYVDQGSTQGSFIGGVAVRRQLITGETDVALGQRADGARLRLIPSSAAAPPAPPAPERRPAPQRGSATVLPGGRPGGVLGEERAAATEIGGVAGGDPITVTLGDQRKTAYPGQALTIGRGESNDLLSRADATTVSREHARIEHRDGAWRLRDLGSTSGTWVNGQRVQETVLAGRQEIVLGDAPTGDRMITQTSGTAPGSGPAPRPPRERSGGPRLGLVLGGIAALVSLALVVAAGIVAWQLLKPESTSSIDSLTKATVKLDAGDWSGSGVVVDAKHGLILTNAHVAEPNALGQGVSVEGLGGEPSPPSSDKDPTSLLVAVNDGRDTSAEPKFQAEVVAVDGYLDLAILKITRKISGDFVEAKDLAGLTEAKLGDSDSVSTTDKLTLIGYPGLADSENPTVTSGALASFARDDRLKSNRAVFNSTASSAAGNSGGPAVNADGQVVGLLTWGRSDREGGKFAGIRPINYAAPLVKAAKAGKGYHSTVPVAAAPGTAKVDDVDFAEPGSSDGLSTGCQPDSKTSSAFAFAVTYSGFSGGDHTDVAVWLFKPDDKVQSVWTAYPTKLPPSGCLTFTAGELSSGDYELMIAVGGDMKVLYDKTFTL